MKTKYITEANPCYTCNSKKLDYSIGVMFGVVSIYCKECGCQSESSDTDRRSLKTRKNQALNLWNKKRLQKNCWPHYNR